MPASGVFSKLQLKDQQTIVVLDPPGTFEKELNALKGVEVERRFTGAKVGFVLAFMTKRAELERFATGLQGRADGDAVVWVAYPKGSSKRYQSDIGRDAGWQELGRLGYEPVRMVAIDHDWTALRFRKAEFIKLLKRSSEHAISRVGKARAGARRGQERKETGRRKGKRRT